MNDNWSTFGDVLLAVAAILVCGVIVAAFISTSVSNWKAGASRKHRRRRVDKHS
jgi:hypothetical protein